MAVEASSGGSPTKGSTHTLSRQTEPYIPDISTISKVCETVVTRWMMQDMEEYLDTTQFGNRKGCSTTHYLVNIVQFILTEGECGRHTNFLAIDYSKAFDKVYTV